MTNALRETLDGLREQIGAGLLAEAPDAQPIARPLAPRRWRCARRLGLRRTINATGIVLHTNLGRAPLAREAIAAVAHRSPRAIAIVEFDLATGRRGSRTQAIEPLLRELTGAEAALAVNNGAAAILLALSALGGGGEVIVSRGELVEIGGGFRMPDVIRQGGARLVEVGTTNKTRLEDYRAAIGPDTRVLLKVHQSNFRTVGFTAETGIAELAGLARETGPCGGGRPRQRAAARDAGFDTSRPSAQALSAGADLVTCSGDKLLGGPQAGLILARKKAPSIRCAIIRCCARSGSTR